MNKEEAIKIIEQFWEDEELQEAITLYGEWNGEELEKAKDKAIEKLINNLK
jgi:hypothetical protein